MPSLAVDLQGGKYDPCDILAKLVFWTSMLFVLQLAFGVFGPNPVSDLLSNLLGAVQGGQLMAKGAGIAILVFAAFAALDQLQIAPRIVTGLWYALVGSVVVAVGGGGIQTMQRYWDRAAGRAEHRGSQFRQQAQRPAQPVDHDGSGLGAPAATEPLGASTEPSRRFRRGG